MPQIIRKRIPYVGNIYDSQPVGEIIQCERETPPAGYIELGETRKSVLRSKYPELFKQIGTTYGAEDDEHFNLPSADEVDSISTNELEWKDITNGGIVGNTTINLPSDWKELMCMITERDLSTENYSIYVLRKMVVDTPRLFINGHYNNSGSSARVKISVSNQSVHLVETIHEGVDSTSLSRISVYYR